MTLFWLEDHGERRMAMIQEKTPTSGKVEHNGSSFSFPLSSLSFLFFPVSLFCLLLNTRIWSNWIGSFPCQIVYWRMTHDNTLAERQTDNTSLCAMVATRFQGLFPICKGHFRSTASDGTRPKGRKVFLTRNLEKNPITRDSRTFNWHFLLTWKLEKSFGKNWKLFQSRTRIWTLALESIRARNYS